MRKRKNVESGDGEGMNTSTGCIPPSTTEPPMKLAKTSNTGKTHQESVILKTYMADATSSAENRKARETRLEQNRKAARESRRRKKVMIEDLQRSVIFFSRANGTLKHQNDDLTRLLMQAQGQASVIESTRNQMNSIPVPAATTSSTPVTNSQLEQGSQFQQVVTFSSENEPLTPQTFPNEAITPSTVATAATLHPSIPTYQSVPAMQPGATMQAMASFQQAAAAAMHVAVQGMQGISPGASLTSLAQPLPTNGSSSAQQAYNDTMTALAMQQAAIAAAAVPPHVMAQIVGSACNSTGWVPAPASTVPASVAPVTILPAATIQATSTTASSATAPAPAATEKGTSMAGSNPVFFAVMP